MLEVENQESLLDELDGLTTVSGRFRRIGGIPSSLVVQFNQIEDYDTTVAGLIYGRYVRSVKEITDRLNIPAPELFIWHREMLDEEFANYNSSTDC